MEHFNFYAWLAAMVLLVFANNIVGMLEALATKTFDKAKALLGLAKGGGVALGLIAIFYAAQLIPNVELQIGGSTFSLHGVLALLMYAILVPLVVKAVKKIAEIAGVKVKGITEATTDESLLGGGREESNG